MAISIVILRLCGRTCVGEIYRKVLKILHVQTLWCLFPSNNWHAMTQFKVLILQLNTDDDKLLWDVVQWKTRFGRKSCWAPKLSKSNPYKRHVSYKFE